VGYLIILGCYVWFCGKRNFKRRREQSLSAFFYHCWRAGSVSRSSCTRNCRLFVCGSAWVSAFCECWVSRTSVRTFVWAGGCVLGDGKSPLVSRQVCSAVKFLRSLVMTAP